MTEQVQFKWIFPNNDGGQITGATNISDEHFRDAKISQALAREMCQNSLDAHKTDRPAVHIEFKLFDISPSQIPDYDGLEDAITKCLNMDSNNDETRKKFEEALSLLKASSIPVLRISDFNTTGLTGSSKPLNTPWVNLVKAVGSSNKKSESGGSFGIGKATAFAASILNTVFFSTYDEEEVKVHQGVARLISFKNDEMGYSFSQGTGYFGTRDETTRWISPATGEMALDPDFSRSEGQYGTDIYILGFKGSFEEIKLSVLDGFFYAIHSEKLTVQIADEIIDKDNLGEHINNLNIPSGEQIFVKEYYASLTNPDIYREKETNRKNCKGVFKLWIKMDETYSCHVAQIRATGMKIMDNGKPAESIKKFSGVLLATGSELNAMLKACENPAHTHWNPKRAIAGSYTSTVNNVFTELKNFYSEVMEEYKPQYQDKIDLFLNTLLSYDDPSSDKSEEKTESDDFSEVNKSFTDIQTITGIKGAKGTEDVNSTSDDTYYSDASGSHESDDALSGAGFHNGGKNSKSHGGENIGDYEGNNYKPQLNSKGVVKVLSKTLSMVGKNKGKYAVVIRVEEDVQNATAEVKMISETGIYEANVLEADIGGHKLNVSHSKIHGINLSANLATVIYFSIDYPDRCNLEVVLK